MARVMLVDSSSEVFKDKYRKDMVIMEGVQPCPITKQKPKFGATLVNQIDGVSVVTDVWVFMLPFGFGGLIVGGYNYHVILHNTEEEQVRRWWNDSYLPFVKKVINREEQINHKDKLIGDLQKQIHQSELLKETEDKFLARYKAENERLRAEVEGLKQLHQNHASELADCQESLKNTPKYKVGDKVVLNSGHVVEIARFHESGDMYKTKTLDGNHSIKWRLVKNIKRHAQLDNNQTYYTMQDLPRLGGGLVWGYAADLGGTEYELRLHNLEYPGHRCLIRKWVAPTLSECIKEGLDFVELFKPVGASVSD